MASKNNNGGNFLSHFGDRNTYEEQVAEYDDAEPTFHIRFDQQPAGADAE